MEYKEWFDAKYLIHLNRFPDIQDSENGPLFSAEFHCMFNKMYNKKHIALPRSITTVNPTPGIYLPSAAGGEHFSHDNMTGLYCMYYLFSERVPQFLPIYTKYVKHPRDLLFYTYAKLAHKKGYFWKLITHLLLILPSLAMLVSCWQIYKVRGGNKIVKTDGKILTWLRCETFGLTKTWKLANLILRFRSPFISWKSIFAAYFQRPGHPLNDMSLILGDFK